MRDLSTLAKLLAEEDISVVHKKTKTASLIHLIFDYLTHNNKERN